MSIQTAEEYQAWVRNRSKEPSKWNLDDCIQADALVKQATLENLKTYLGQYPAHIQEFVYNICRVHFGSSDVDAFLMNCKVYPAWID